MQLHRAHIQPDWELVAADRRNVWQRIAAQTGGVVTPGNITSVVGAGLVALGLLYVAQDRLWLGFLTMGVGRFLDIVDGTLADRTGTKSPLGESIDASLDKVAVFAALIVFTAEGVLPWPFALFVGLQNGTTALLSMAAKSLKRTIHPVASGKIGGAVVWAALLLFVLAAAIDGAPALTAIAYILAVLSVFLNCYATVRYAQAFRAHK